MSFLPKESFYVSIKFLASLMGIEHLPQVGESDFIYTGKVIKDAHPDYPKSVPIRDKDGMLIDCKPRPKNLEDFLDIWLKAWNERARMRPQPRLFRARYSDPIISKIVAIKILDDGKQRFDKLVSLNGLHTVTAEGVFKKLIDAYNSNGNCILGLWDDEWPKDKENYVLLSQNPFNLYQTWIHKDSVDEYMKEIERETLVQNAVRYLPNGPTVLKNLAIVRKEIDSAMTLQSIGETIDTHRDEEIEEEHLVLEPPSHTVETSLLPSKILKAVSQDGGSAAQIMRMSAPELAGRALQWQWEPGMTKSQMKTQKYQMPNSLYIAEWLHLSAFSFGGIDKIASKNVVIPNVKPWMSSQRKDNLVLGTSETNSCMTRYERAWQTLLLYEQNLQNKYQASSKKITGILKVERNPPDVSILYDWADPKDFMVPLEYTYGWRSGKLKEMPIGSSLTNLARFHKYLAFVIKYDLSIDESFILKPPNDAKDEAGPVKTTVFFYPFLRSLYHKAEAKLDSDLYRILRVDAECMLYERTKKPKDNESKNQNQFQNKLEQFRKKLYKLLEGTQAAGDEDLDGDDNEKEALINDLGGGKLTNE